MAGDWIRSVRREIRSGHRGQPFHIKVFVTRGLICVVDDKREYIGELNKVNKDKDNNTITYCCFISCSPQRYNLFFF